MKWILGMSLSFLAGCVVVPVNDESFVAQCAISSNRKTLRVMDVAKETNSYYSLEGTLATPIVFPTSAIISGIYVAVNNIYTIGDQTLRCGH